MNWMNTSFYRKNGVLRTGIVNRSYGNDLSIRVFAVVIKEDNIELWANILHSALLIFKKLAKNEISVVGGRNRSFSIFFQEYM